jgi:KDO2-lipid IV(A) lauroyltransferase
MSGRLRYLAEYIPLYILVRLFSALPLNLSRRVGKRLGRLLYWIDMKHRRIAVENLTTTIGVSRDKAAAIAKRVFENLGLTFAEFLNVSVSPKGFFEENVTVEGFENYQRAKEAGKGVLLLGAHFGSWELLAAAHLIKMGQAASVVYKRTKNPYVDRYIDSIRRSYGLKTIPHRNSVREIMAALRRGEGVGILLDQHARGREAVMADFLGRPAPTNIGLALIALKTGAPVVPLFSVREGDRCHRIIYEEAIWLRKSGDIEKDILDATTRFNEVIGRYVKSHPEQWFWVHNRWRVQRDRKRGEGMEEGGKILQPQTSNLKLQG